MNSQPVTMEDQAVKWTIMAYINADNILANFAVESLKKLRNTAGENVTVIAEFADNQPIKGKRPAHLYRFDSKSKESNAPLEEFRIKEQDIENLKKIAPLNHIDDVDMTRPENLTEFINFASEISPAERYCLILWGHGIELLLDDDQRFAAVESSQNCSSEAESKTSGSAPSTNGESEDDAQPVRYLTTTNLRKALADARGNRPALDIIGFDACSMTMIEVASAVQGYAGHMIASQEDVPDMSFPYDRIVKELQTSGVGSDVKRICQKIAELYGHEYRDYIASPGTGVKGITMASVDLQKIEKVAAPLKELSQALLRASRSPEKCDAILSARKDAKDFVFGILVDLGDFCKHLQKNFEEEPIKDPDILSACSQIQDALKPADEGFMVANQVSQNDPDCHGLSIYLPYRAEKDPTDDLQETLSKGTGTRPLKGTGSRPLKGTGTRPLKERAARIKELETDFSTLEQLLENSWLPEWMKFIRSGWSRILASKVQSLDYYYSAEQCAANLVAADREAPAGGEPALIKDEKAQTKAAA